MNSTRKTLGLTALGVAVSLFTAASPSALSQSLPAESNVAVARADVYLTLPDAPSAALDAAESSSSTAAEPSEPAGGFPKLFGYNDAERATHMASHTDKYILPGQLAPKLDTGDKVELGFIHGISAYGVAGWLVSAGYSHIINTTPNYGRDSGAFGERLGAAALRGYSDEVLRDSLMANVFHQDPRYYKLGSDHNVVVRTLYSVTRTLVTRGDDGRLAPNYSLVAGNAVGAALTNAYYPNVDRGFSQTAKTFGNSMYGTAFSFFAAEFLNGALEAVHLKGDRD